VSAKTRSPALKTDGSHRSGRTYQSYLLFGPWPPCLQELPPARGYRIVMNYGVQVQLFRLRNKRRCHAERRRHPESPVEFRSRPLHITLGKMRDPGRLTRIAYEQACLTRHSLKRNPQHAALVRTASPPRPPPSSPPDPRKAVSRCRRATRGRQQLFSLSGRSKPSRPLLL